MAYHIICDRTRARKICPDCGVEPIGKPAAKRCIECTDAAIERQNAERLARRRAIGTPRDIADRMRRRIDIDRETAAIAALRLKGGR